jgi:hypothetical protein
MLELTPSQSHYVLQAFLRKGRVRLLEVRKTLKTREQEIRDLKERLKALEDFASPARRLVRRRPPRVRRRVSGRVRALRRLQGRYMGFVRRLKSAEKARVKAVREKQGLEEAIRLASSLVPKTKKA